MPSSTPLAIPSQAVLRYAVPGGGQVVFTLPATFRVGSAVVIDLDLTAGSLPINGPMQGRILLADMRHEFLIRTLPASDVGTVTVAAGQRAHTQVTWDSRDDAGLQVAPETYSLTVEFLVGSEQKRLGTVIQIE